MKLLLVLRWNGETDQLQPRPSQAVISEANPTNSYETGLLFNQTSHKLQHVSVPVNSKSPLNLFHHRTQPGARDVSR